jgi:hypothetical protein
MFTFGYILGIATVIGGSYLLKTNFGKNLKPDSMVKDIKKDAQSLADDASDSLELFKKRRKEDKVRKAEELLKQNKDKKD